MTNLPDAPPTATPPVSAGHKPEYNTPIQIGAFLEAVGKYLEEHAQIHRDIDIIGAKIVKIAGTGTGDYEEVGSYQSLPLCVLLDAYDSFYRTALGNAGKELATLPHHVANAIEHATREQGVSHEIFAECREEMKIKLAQEPYVSDHEKVVPAMGFKDWAARARASQEESSELAL